MLYHISSVKGQSLSFQNNLKDQDPSCKMVLICKIVFFEEKNSFYSWITQDWFYIFVAIFEG